MENAIDRLESRGLLEATTSPDLRGAIAKPVRFYIGFDPTADSLHIGNLVGIVVAAHLQQCGHEPVILVGGATGLVGDPSGKSAERPLLTPELVEQNLEGIRRDLKAVLGEPHFVNNYDWYQKMSAIDYLRDVGRFFRLGPMLGKEMVRSRLESDEGLSYTEFSYQILQGYDFLHLFDHENVVLELGGADQWGNITAGTELVRRLRGETVHGLTFPLLTRSDGKKFGKTEGGAVWLSPDKLSPYDFYQYLYRIPDADVLRMMRMLTFMDLEEIHQWEQKMESADYVPNSAQKRLAHVLTELIHGEQGLKLAEQVTMSMAPGSKEAELSAASLESAGIPTCDLERGAVLGAPYLDLLVASKLVTSKGEARRLVRNGGAYLNNAKIEDEAHILSESDLIEGRLLLVGAGKKRKVVIRF